MQKQLTLKWQLYAKNFVFITKNKTCDITEMQERNVQRETAEQWVAEMAAHNPLKALNAWML